MTETKPADTAAPVTPAPDTTAPDMPTPETPELQGDEAKPQPALPHHQKDGRYIPYSGGSLGWFENSGVLKSERVNNYAFSTVLDGDLVRAKQYVRAGMQTEKRRSQRKEPVQELLVTLKSSTEEQTARVVDLSAEGLKVTYVGDQTHLNELDKVACRFPPATGGVPLELECTVVHKE